MPAQTEKALLTWDIKETHSHERGRLWYVVAVLIGGGLLLYALLTRNFLFGFIVIMVALILAIHSAQPARSYRCTITGEGMGIGERLYPWKDIARFWILETPQVRTLYIDFGGLRPRIPLPLQDSAGTEVRKTLEQFVKEDTTKTEEPFSDWLARVLKL